jgi:hypothetical protein
MRRVWSVAVLTATLTAMGGGVAVAQEEVDGSSNSADRLTGITCRMRLSTDGTRFIRTTDSKAVITSNGVITLVCHAKINPEDPQGVEPLGVPFVFEPFTQSGFPCNLAGQPATTSHIVWTPSGQGTITCSRVPAQVPD